MRLPNSLSGIAIRGTAEQIANRCSDDDDDDGDDDDGYMQKYFIYKGQTNIYQKN